MLKNRITLPVPHPVSIHLGDWRWRGRPKDPEIVIADVDRAAGRIGDRIVGPLGQAMALAVAAPGEAGTRFGNERAEVRVGHDVHPWRGRMGSLAEVNDIFLRVLGKAAEPVEILQFHEWQRTRRFFAERFSGYPRHRLRADRHRSGELLAQRAPRGHEHHMRGGLKQDELFLGNLARRAQEYPAGLIHTGQLGVGFGEPAQMGGERLLIAVHLFADQYQIDLQSAEMPESVRRQNLPNDLDVALMADRHDDDRQVARDPLRPERTLTRHAAPEPGRGRPQTRLREKDVRAEMLKKLHVSGADVEAAHLELGMRPRHLKGARRDAKFRVALDQSNHRLARFGDHGDEGKLQALIGQDRHATTQTEDGIEDRADTAAQGAPDGLGTFQGVATAQKARAVRLKLGRINRGRLHDHQVRRPDRLIMRRAWTPPGEERLTFGQPLGLDEEFVESRMRAVGLVRGQREFEVAGQFEAARLLGDVHQGHSPDLGVVLGRHHDLGEGIARTAALSKFRSVGGEVPCVEQPRRTHWLMGDAPEHSAVEVLDVTGRPRHIAGGIRVPASDIQIAPAEVTSTGICHHHRTGAVGKQLRPRRRGVRRVRWGGGSASDRSHARQRALLAHLARGWDDRRGDPLVEQRLGGAQPRIRMEPGPHHVLVQCVVEREQRHPVVMDHVAAHHDPRFATGFAAP